ncbi:MAG: DUF1788 domain-containing protein [Gemmatimonadales bacterium]|nr:MAG: DUF1788 domain-containing protein [Gemmatimonadales bacterium]
MDQDFLVDGGEMARVGPKLFDLLKAVITGPRILGGDTPGNDVPFFLCPYEPEGEAAMQPLISDLATEIGATGTRILTLDLYRIAIDLLHRTGRWDRLLSRETRDDKVRFLTLLQSTLNEEEVLVPEIRDLVARTPHELIFLTGFAPVFPMIRSYTILSRLQSVLKEAPTVIFFPGRYTQDGDTGFSLKMLGLLRERNYYRAHNILHMRGTA